MVWDPRTCVQDTAKKPQVCVTLESGPDFLGVGRRRATPPPPLPPSQDRLHSCRMMSQCNRKVTIP